MRTLPFSVNDRPLLSIIIPTIGRPGLRRTLESVRQQRAGIPVETLLVGDTLDGPLPEVEALAAEYGARYVAHDGGLHMVGHPQRTEGAKHARGAWLHYLSDDDILTRGALASIALGILTAPEPMPLLFRVTIPRGFPVWSDHRLCEGDIDASCLVVPNDERVAPWGLRYNGDFDMIAQTVANYGGRAIWNADLIVSCRPMDGEDWTR